MTKYLLMGMFLVIVAVTGLLGWEKLKVKDLLIVNQQLSTQVEVAEGNLTVAKTAYNLQAEQVAAFQEKIAEMEAQRVESRKQVEYVRNLFMDHDFRKLLEKKPGLIEKRMIAATAKVLKELEDATK